MSAGVDEGILDLIGQRRLSAVSCLSKGPTLVKSASSLAPLDVDKGLHLNFTEALGEHGTYHALPQLLLRSYLGRLSPRAIQAQIERQLDAFEDAFGQPPDHVDGHQHVHQLPQIRTVLLSCLQRRYAHLPWLRFTPYARIEGVPWRLQNKARIIALLGSATLGRQARKAGFSGNQPLPAIYDFAEGPPDYAQLMRLWLAAARDGDLLMCHPARLPSAGDGIGEQRTREFRFLISPSFAVMLQHEHIELTRPSRRTRVSV